jgi:hypothetical protein
MSTLKVAIFVTMFAGGIWLGVIVAIAVERTSVWKRMPLDQYVVDFRRSVRRVDPMQPILSVVTALGALLLALNATGLSRGLAWAGFGLVVVVIVSSVLIGEPINTKFRRREEGDAPVGAALLRDRWIRFHWIRTYVAIASFLALVSATAVHVG